MAKTQASGGPGPAGAIELARSPSHLLHRALQHALDIYAEAAGPGAPTQRQFAVLSAVAENEGLSQTALVQATGIDRSTLAELVARMIGKGLLARERSPADARANLVRLTEAGRAALAEAAPKVTAADARILALLPERDRDQLLSVLSALSAAAEHLPVLALSKARGDVAAPEAAPEPAPAGKPEKKAKKSKNPDAERAGKTEKKKKKKKG